MLKASMKYGIPCFDKLHPEKPGGENHRP